MNAQEQMLQHYYAAQVLYRTFEQGQRESIQDELNQTRQTGRGKDQARKVGRIRWADSQQAKGNIDDQKFAERKTQLHGIVALNDALELLRIQMEALTEELQQFVRAWEGETKSEPDPDK